MRLILSRKLKKRVMKFILSSLIILRKYNYHDCKHVVTPFDFSVHVFLVNDDNDVVNQKECASIISSLRYVIDCTRPNTTYDAVGVLSRFTSKPSKDHWHAIERVMKYLSSSKSHVCFIKNILLYLNVLVMLTGTPCQVILYLPLVTFLLWVGVQYVGNLKKQTLLLTLLWRLSL